MLTSEAILEAMRRRLDRKIVTADRLVQHLTADGSTLRPEILYALAYFLAEVGEERRTSDTALVTLARVLQQTILDWDEDAEARRADDVWP